MVNASEKGECERRDFSYAWRQEGDKLRRHHRGGASNQGEPIASVNHGVLGNTCGPK